MRRLKACVCLLLLLSVACLAQERGAFETGGFGARAKGMGNAVVSLVSDSASVYWNVAGLAEGRSGNVILSNQDLYGLGVGNNQLAVSMPLKKIGVAGFSYERTDFSQAVDFGYFEEKVGVGIAREFAIKKFESKIKLGLSLNFYRANLDSVAAKAKTTGGGLNFGLLLPLGEKLQVGITGRDLLNSLKSQRVFEDATETKTERLPASLTVGVSYEVGDNLLLAVDVADFSQLNLGGEYRLSDKIFLRGGLSGKDFTAGIGARMGRVKFDYSYSPTVLGASGLLTLALDF